MVSLFARLPGVGEKTAQRFALYLVTQGGSLATDLGRELCHLVEDIRRCDNCGNIAAVGPDGTALCEICMDPERDEGLLCIVHRVQDLLAIERSSSMHGRYFVLGRLLSPLDGVGPEALPVEQLRERIRRDGTTEVLLATPSSVEGEATALFLGRELAGSAVAVTRIASGVPHGGDLEFADQITLGRAIVGRRALGERS